MASAPRALQALAVLVVTVATAGAAQRPAAVTHTVTMENLQFSPAELTVNRGDRIVWVNKDLFPHTATADGKAFDSQGIAANASWTYVAATLTSILTLLYFLFRAGVLGGRDD